MPFKALRLSRTNIFYPSKGSTHDLGSLLHTLTLTQDSLDDILDIEDATYENGKQGTNTDDLEKLISVAKKASLLSNSVQRKIYFHILRQSIIPKKCNKSDLAILFLAYHDIMAQLYRGYPACFFCKLTGLQIFGYYDHLDLDQRQPLSYEEFKYRMAVLKQCDRYNHIPGMLEKIDKFRPFAADDKIANRTLTLLRMINYQLERSWIELKFWGFITIVLLNKTVRQVLLNDLVTAKNTNTLSHFDNHVEILERFVIAIDDSDLSAQFIQFKEKCSES